jgi:hypothetical protein
VNARHPLNPPKPGRKSGEKSTSDRKSRQSRGLDAVRLAACTSGLSLERVVAISEWYERERAKQEIRELEELARQLMVRDRALR